jgi:hypothetical protein
MNSARLNAIEQELTTLKRSIRRWRTTTWLLLLGAGLLAATTGSPNVFDHIVVNRIDVIGTSGKPVVSISQSEFGGRFDIYHQDGTNLLRLSSTASGGDIALWDDAGTNVAGIWSTDQGGAFSLWNNDGAELSKFQSGALTLTGMQASLHIQNEHGIPVAVVASDPGGHGRFQIADANGNVVSEMRMIPDLGGAMIVNHSSGKRMGLLAASSDGGRLNLLNQHGVPIFIASTMEGTNGGALSVINERGIPVVIIKSDDMQLGLIELFDADGEGARRIRPIRGYSP